MIDAITIACRVTEIPETVDNQIISRSKVFPLTVSANYQLLLSNEASAQLVQQWRDEVIAGYAGKDTLREIESVEVRIGHNEVTLNADGSYSLAD